MDWKQDNTKIGFQPMLPRSLDNSPSQLEAGPICLSTPDKEACQEFGLKPNINSVEFNFEQEIQWLSFKLNKRKESCRSLVFSGTVHWFEGRQAFIHYCGLHQV